MSKIFVTAHTPHGVFSGVVNSESLSLDDAKKTRDELQKAGSRLMSLVLYDETVTSEHGPAEVLLVEKVLQQSVLVFEIR